MYQIDRKWKNINFRSNFNERIYLMELKVLKTKTKRGVKPFFGVKYNGKLKN